MLMAQSAALSQVERDPHGSPAAVVEAVNRVLHENVHRRMRRDDYLTMMAARHVGGGRFVAAGAHQPIFVARAGGAVEIVESIGPYCGPLPSLRGRVPEYEFQVGPGDALCLITDGVVEARALDGACYGEERLQGALAASPIASAHAAVERVFTEVDGFMSRQEDDMTVLLVRREAHHA
jgi:sigma-B regulation protein RsbU (phosphoserine phosphatase)